MQHPCSSSLKIKNSEHTSYPLHRAVFENDLSSLIYFLNSQSKELIDQEDIHGTTPVMLATILNHIECAELLLSHGANSNTQNRGMWNLSNEAVLLSNPSYLKKVMMYRDYQRDIKTLKTLCKMRDGLTGFSDFYVEIGWDFITWMPFIKNYFPSDSYKIYKNKNTIRIDTNNVKDDPSRRSQSFICRFTENDSALILFLDHYEKSGSHQYIDLLAEPRLEDFTPSDEIVQSKLRKPITTTYINFDGIGLEKSSTSSLFSWIGSSEKEEEVEGYTCRQFDASNVELVTKICIDHLSEEEKIRFNNSKSSKGIFSKNLFEKKRIINIAKDRFDGDVYGGLDANSYLSGLSNDPIGRPRQEIVKSNTFNASLWLSDSFPLKLRNQISPILDLLAVRDSKFSRLKSFIEFQLPSGFPVKIKIPIFHMINAQITFKNVNEPTFVQQPLSSIDSDEHNDATSKFFLPDSLFEIPQDYQLFYENSLFLFDRFQRTENIPYLDRNHFYIDGSDHYPCFLDKLDDSISISSTENSDYHRQIDMAIRESFETSSLSQNQPGNLLDQSNDDFERALELSRIEEEERKREENDEQEELKRILELSLLDK